MVLGVTGPAYHGEVKIVNGKWFNGVRFESRTMYMSGEQFIAKPRTEPDSVIDLHGGYVVPPFAEAHNHNFDASSPETAKAVIDKYTTDGVFYGQNPANVIRARDGLIGFINKPSFAIADIAIAICKGVTAIPCPIGIRLTERPFHLLTGCEIPGDSPGKEIPVRVPKPKR